MHRDRIVALNSNFGNIHNDDHFCNNLDYNNNIYSTYTHLEVPSLYSQLATKLSKRREKKRRRNKCAQIEGLNFPQSPCHYLHHYFWSNATDTDKCEQIQTQMRLGSANACTRVSQTPRTFDGSKHIYIQICSHLSVSVTFFLFSPHPNNGSHHPK